MVIVRRNGEYHCSHFFAAGRLKVLAWHHISTCDALAVYRTGEFGQGSEGTFGLSELQSWHLDDLRLCIHSGHRSLASELDYAALVVGGIAVARRGMCNKVVDDDSDNDNNDNKNYNQNARSVDWSNRSDIGIMDGCNLPQIPKQIHFFLRVFFEISTATSSCSLPL